MTNGVAGVEIPVQSKVLAYRSRSREISTRAAVTQGRESISAVCTRRAPTRAGLLVDDVTLIRPEQRLDEDIVCRMQMTNTLSE